MNNDEIYDSIGKRIRQLRVSAGLTQEKLCNGFITRNMLSRIETGDARPSLDTLLYLASRLGISPSYFFCADDGQRAQLDKIGRVGGARELFSAGRYEKCAALLRGSHDDEEAFMLTVSEGRMAVSALDKGAVGSAMVHIQRAEEGLCDTVYLRIELADELELTKKVCKTLCGEALPSSLSVVGTDCILFGAVRRNFLLGAALIAEKDISASLVAKLLPERSAYRYCLEAALMTEAGQIEKSHEILISLKNVSHGALCDLMILENLEICCRELGDFKAAYNAAAGRRTLIENFKKQL